MALQTQLITATVLSIGDGDTIRVRRSDGRPLSVRLACIRPWDFRRSHRVRSVGDGNTADDRRWRCREVGSDARAQTLRAPGHNDRDREACASVR